MNLTVVLNLHTNCDKSQDHTYTEHWQATTSLDKSYTSIGCLINQNNHNKLMFFESLGVCFLLVPDSKAAVIAVIAVVAVEAVVACSIRAQRCPQM